MGNTCNGWTNKVPEDYTETYLVNQFRDFL